MTDTATATMSVTSRTACRDRAMFWMLRADNAAQNVGSVTLGLAANSWSAATGLSSVAQAWATLALSAPED